MKQQLYYIIAVDYMQSIYTDDFDLSNALYCALGECFTNQVKEGHRDKRFEMTKQICGVETTASLNTCTRLYNEKCKSASFAIHRDAFWSMYNGKVSEQGIINYMAYLALKSIQGKRTFAKCSNSLWLSRMACSTKITAVFPGQVKNLNTKYKCKNLRKKMQQLFGVSFFIPNGVKGFFFSCTLTSAEIEQALKHEYKECTELPF